MKNYLDEIYTVSEFKRDHPALAEMAERALNYLKRYRPNSADATLGEMIAPFDKDRVYPLQELVTQYAFKRYH